MAKHSVDELTVVTLSPRRRMWHHSSKSRKRWAVKEKVNTLSHIGTERAGRHAQGTRLPCEGKLGEGRLLCVGRHADAKLHGGGHARRNGIRGRTGVRIAQGRIC